MNMESNNISQCQRKGPLSMAVTLHACFVTGSFLCKGATVSFVHNKRIPQCTKMKICIPSLMTLVMCRNYEPTLKTTKGGK